MPFKSQAQRALFHARPELRKYIPEFEAATPKGRKLPKHVRPRSGRHASLLKLRRKGA